MPLSRTRRSSALALAGLTVTALGAGVVQAEVASAAGAARVNTTIKLTPNKSKLTGKVKSPKASCTKGKTVKLFWQPPSTTDYQKVRSDKSDKTGAWVVNAPGGDGATIPSGRYYVTVAASKGCKASKSDVIKVK